MREENLRVPGRKETAPTVRRSPVRWLPIAGTAVMKSAVCRSTSHCPGHEGQRSPSVSLVRTCPIQEALRARCVATRSDARPRIYAHSAGDQVHPSSARGVALLQRTSGAGSRALIRSAPVWVLFCDDPRCADRSSSSSTSSCCW